MWQMAKCLYRQLRQNFWREVFIWRGRKRGEGENGGKKVKRVAKRDDDDDRPCFNDDDDDDDDDGRRDGDDVP